MKIAIPCAEGKLATHFGHCETFALIEADTPESMKRTDVQPPPHEPGVLPKWLGENGVDVIIAGGMGQRAKSLFDEQNISVVVGASADPPEDLVRAYLNKTLVAGDNVCDH